MDRQERGKALMLATVGNPPGPDESKAKLGLRWAVAILLACALASAAFSGLLRALADRQAADVPDSFIVTTYNLRARTESLSFDPIRALRHAWLLPRGTATLTPDDRARGCPPPPRPEDSTCQVELGESSILSVDGDSRVSLFTVAGGLVVTVRSAAGGAFSARITDAAGGEVAASGSLLVFEIAAADSAMRLPLVLSAASVGSPLYENVTAGETDSAQQNMLLEGSWEVVAGIGTGKGRDSFVVTQGRLEAGDLLTVERSCRSGDGRAEQREDDGAIRGVATVERGGDTRPSISLTLSSCLPLDGTSVEEIRLNRFGSTAPTLLAMPSRLVVLGMWPQWDAFWLMLLAMMALAQFFFGIAGYGARPRPLAMLKRWLGRRRGAGDQAQPAEPPPPTATPEPTTTAAPGGPTP